MTVDSNQSAPTTGRPEPAPSSIDVDTFDHRVTDEVDEIVEHRGLIEQTKGMLMFVYGISAEQAFEILRMLSEERNATLARADDLADRPVDGQFNNG